MINPTTKKILLLVMAGVLLVSAGFLQRDLNRDRDELGLTRIAPLGERYI